MLCSCPSWLVNCDDLHQQETNRPVSFRLQSILFVTDTRLRSRHSPNPAPISQRSAGPVAVVIEMQQHLHTISEMQSIRYKPLWSGSGTTNIKQTSDTV